MGRIMIHDKFKNAIIDFIDRANEIPNLLSVVLFGSSLEEVISKKSDIDLLLFFDCDHNPEIGEESKATHRLASEICSHHDLAHSFSFVFVNQRNIKEIEPDFLWNIYEKGIIIWGRPARLLSTKPHPSLEPLALISYSAKKLNEKNRRGLMRALYSYRKKGGKLIEKKDERLGPGTLLVKAGKMDELKNIFAKYGLADYSVKKLWGH